MQEDQIRYQLILKLYQISDILKPCINHLIHFKLERIYFEKVHHNKNKKLFKRRCQNDNDILSFKNK